MIEGENSFSLTVLVVDIHRIANGVNPFLLTVVDFDIYQAIGVNPFSLNVVDFDIYHFTKSMGTHKVSSTTNTNF